MDKRSFIEDVVKSTKAHIFVRPDDGLLIIRPNKVHFLNDTASELLSDMYTQPEGNAYQAVANISRKYSKDEEHVAEDAYKLLQTMLEMLKNPDFVPGTVRQKPFGSHKRDLPVLSEIALTYDCQNKCVFCYASAPERCDELKEMTTDEVKQVLWKIRNVAKVPTVSFTGGEPTLRKDLPELVAYAKSLDLRVNLITNGIISGLTDLPDKLKEAGLDSAQVSLEASTAEVHDRVVGLKGAFESTVKGIMKLKALGIHTHINTTICSDNIDHMVSLPKFAKEELGLTYESMNMVIRTGHAQDHPDEIGYTEVAKKLPEIQRACHEAGIKLVWYSPMPYCIINTVACGIGTTSCAAADGLLSIAPDGSVLPCSSFKDGMGNILRQNFDDIWWSSQALYFRRKKFIPPVCKDCDKANVCLAACPLYWDNKGCFDELGKGKSQVGTLVWKAKRRLLGKSRPVGGVKK